MPEPECKCGKCRASQQTGQPVCACGKQLEEGFLGVLWCPDCGDDWKEPEGTTPESNPEYYMTIDPKLKEFMDFLETATEEQLEAIRQRPGVIPGR